MMYAIRCGEINSDAWHIKKCRSKANTKNWIHNKTKPNHSQNIYLFIYFCVHFVHFLVETVSPSFVANKTSNMSIEVPCIKYNQNNNPYIELGDYEIRLENEKPDEAVLQKSRDELREVPEITAPAILELRELVKGNVRRNFT